MNNTITRGGLVAALGHLGFTYPRIPSLLRFTKPSEIIIQNLI